MGIRTLARPKPVLPVHQLCLRRCHQRSVRAALITSGPVEKTATRALAAAIWCGIGAQYPSAAECAVEWRNRQKATTTAHQARGLKFLPDCQLTSQILLQSRQSRS